MSNPESRPTIGFSVLEAGYYCDIFQPPLDDEERHILDTTDSVAPFAKMLTADKGAEIWAYRDYYFGMGVEDQRLPDFYKHLRLFSESTARKLKRSPTQLGEKAVIAFRKAEKQFIEGLKLSEFADADQTIDPPPIRIPKRYKAPIQRA